MRSPHFPPNTCGNKWLDLYNAASHSTGGIGNCGGSWDTTVDDMVSVGLQDDPANLPWPNASKPRDVVVGDFCSCIHCAFLPAVNDSATLVIPSQCQTATPSLESVVIKLALSLCGSAAPTSANACPGYVYAAQTTCAQDASACAEVEFVLGISSVAEFDQAAQAAFLASLASYANVPIESIYIKSVRAASVVATVGVLTAYEQDLGEAVLQGPSTGTLSSALGVPVMAVAASGDTGGSAGFPMPLLVVLVLAFVGGVSYWRWRQDRCAGLSQTSSSSSSSNASSYPAASSSAAAATREGGQVSAAAAEGVVLDLPSEAAKASPPVAETKAAKEEEPLAVGVRVELCGLKSAPEMNGKQGALVGFKQADGRWMVRLDGQTDKEQMTVKPENLARVR